MFAVRASFRLFMDLPPAIWARNGRVIVVAVIVRQLVVFVDTNVSRHEQSPTVAEGA
jgi:hypothetical protein